MEAANIAGGGGRVVPPHPHPAQPHPLYMPHLAIKSAHQTLGRSFDSRENYSRITYSPQMILINTCNYQAISVAKVDLKIIVCMSVRP